MLNVNKNKLSDLKWLLHGISGIDYGDFNKDQNF